MATSYVELCSGIGGTRSGLQKAGWSCKMSVEKDADAALIHRDIFEQCIAADILDIKVGTVPLHDVLVAGFPCQPFSSVGHETGFDHPSGNVFDGIIQILREHKTKVVFLENVQGLLSNRFGHSMACVLQKLSELGYLVEWLLTNTSWFGIPQTRPRVFIVAHKNTTNILNHRDLFNNIDLQKYFYEESIFQTMIDAAKLSIKYIKDGEISDTVSSRTPRIGKKKPSSRSPFNSAGIAFGDKFATFSVRAPHLVSHNKLGEICCPNFKNKDEVRSVRYYARGKPTQAYARKEPIAHCVGTSIGGAPLFSISNNLILSEKESKDVLQFSNWHQSKNGTMVFRLTPERAALLFGPYMEELKSALNKSSLTTTKKYILLGNIVAPLVAKLVAQSIDKKFFVKNR